MWWTPIVEGTIKHDRKGKPKIAGGFGRTEYFWWSNILFYQFYETSIYKLIIVRTCSGLYRNKARGFSYPFLKVFNELRHRSKFTLDYLLLGPWRHCTILSTRQWWCLSRVILHPSEACLTQSWESSIRDRCEIGRVLTCRLWALRETRNQVMRSQRTSSTT